jgi:hypothetical protein
MSAVQEFKNIQTIPTDPKLIHAKQKLIEKLERVLENEKEINEFLETKYDSDGEPERVNKYENIFPDRDSDDSDEEDDIEQRKDLLARFVKGVDESYKHRANQEILSNMLKEAKRDLERLEAMEPERREYVRKTLTIIFRNGVIRPNIYPGARDNYQWEYANKYQSWDRIGDVGQVVIRPGVNYGKVRLHYTDEDEEESIVSNAIDIETVIKRQSGAAKRKPYRFGADDPEFIVRCSGVAGRILRLTQPRIRTNTEFNMEGARFSMRVFQDRVARLPEHLDLEVEEIIELCEHELGSDDDFDAEYINMVEFCEPTIHLNPAGLRRELKAIGTGKRVFLRLAENDDSDSEEEPRRPPRRRRRQPVQEESEESEESESDDDQAEGDDYTGMNITGLKKKAKQLRIPRYTTYANTPRDRKALANLIRNAIDRVEYAADRAEDAADRAEEVERRVLEELGQTSEEESVASDTEEESAASEEEQEEGDDYTGMNITNLKKKARELGIPRYTTFDNTAQGRKDLADLIRQAEAKDEEDDVSGTEESDASDTAEESAASGTDVSGSEEEQAEDDDYTGMNITGLKNKARELGIPRYTTFDNTAQGRKDLADLIRQAEAKDEEDDVSGTEESDASDTAEESDASGTDVSGSEEEQAEDDDYTGMNITNLKKKARELGIPRYTTYANTVQGRKALADLIRQAEAAIALEERLASVSVPGPRSRARREVEPGQVSLAEQYGAANRQYQIPSGALAEMVANMSDDWASSEDELNFAEDSESDELGSDQLQFAESSAVEHNESGSLEFAESSAVETDSDAEVAVQSTSEKTSSGLEFAESSAVDSDSARENGSSSGLGWAESSDYD